jgi:hypothetical protein
MKQKIGVGEDGFGNCVVGDGTPDSVAVVVAAGWMKGRGRVDVWTQTFRGVSLRRGRGA